MKIRLDWRERLAKAVGAAGGNRAKISRAAKLNVTYLRDVLDRGQRPNPENAQKLSDGLGIDISEWFIESGLPAADSAAPTAFKPAITTDLNIQQMPRDLMVLGAALCGDDGLFELNGQVLEYARRPPRLMGVSDAYALYANGESMAPWREHGDLAYVHPHQPPKVNDYVVVQLRPESDGGAIPAYLKRLVKRSASTLHLLQYNPRKELTIPMKRVGAIHRIIDWSELMGI